MAEYNMPQYILREFKVTDARVSWIIISFTSFAFYFSILFNFLVFFYNILIDSVFFVIVVINNNDNNNNNNIKKKLHLLLLLFYSFESFLHQH